MMGYQACITELTKATGIESEDRLEELLETVIRRERRLARDPRHAGLGEDERLMEAARQIGMEVRTAAAIEKRNAALNLKRRIARRQFYEAAPDPLLGIEAKLVGVNTPFAGSRRSVDAQGNALRRDYLAGLVYDLERQGLDGTVKRGTLDAEIARELAELNKDAGAPGISGSREAQAIAATLHRFQTMAKRNLNRAGAWIGDYQGYVAQTSHDPDLIRRAGFEKWRDDVLPLLDERTFDNLPDGRGDDLPDAAARERFLKRIYNGLITGVHLTSDGSAGFKDPAFSGPGNLAKRLSQGRVLHWRDADAFMAYHRQYIRGTLIESVLRSLDMAARNTALMREFGTNPRAEFETDLRWLEQTWRDRDSSMATRLRERRQALANRFDNLDGSANMPVNRMAARIGSGWRAVQSMSKLGGVVLSAITDVPLKAAELRYQGIGLLQAYGDGLVSTVRGRGRGQMRQVADELRAGMDGAIGSIASRFDATDTLPGTLSKIQNSFFKITGLSYWTDAQRAGAEMAMARHLANHAGQAFDALPERTRRMLELFDIGEREWNLLRSVELTEADGRRYMTPSAARRLTDEQVASLLDLEPGAKGRAARIEEARDALAMKLHAYFADRGEFAVLQPGARERAILLQGSRPGAPTGEAYRMVMQFKAFPTAVLTKAFGREIYGGQGRQAAIAGIVHMIVATTIFGYVAMTMKALARGREPRDPTDPRTFAAAMLQGGGLGIFGDFVFGEYNRFGTSPLATLSGPTLGIAEEIARIYGRAREGEDVAPQLVRLATSNVPFANLVWTDLALDYFVLWQVQEALSPGYLQRMERRVAQETGQQFWLKPSSAVR